MKLKSHRSTLTQPSEDPERAPKKCCNFFTPVVWQAGGSGTQQPLHYCSSASGRECYSSFNPTTCSLASRSVTALLLPEFGEFYILVLWPRQIRYMDIGEWVRQSWILLNDRKKSSQLWEGTQKRVAICEAESRVLMGLGWGNACWLVHGGVLEKAPFDRLKGIIQKEPIERQNLSA